MSSPVLPPSWSALLEEIEAALKITLGQIAKLSPPAGASTLSRPSTAPEQRAHHGQSTESLDALAISADLELARSEEALRRWLQSAGRSAAAETGA